MEEQRKISVIDNDVLAEVIVNDTLRTTFGDFNDDIGLVETYCGLLLQGLTGEENQAVMDGVLSDYVQFSQSGSKESILTRSGLAISVNAGGVKDKMIELVDAFSKAGDDAKLAWLNEIIMGQRLSSDSFPPIPTAPAIEPGQMGF